MGTDRRPRAAVLFIAALSCAFPARAAQPEGAAGRPYNLVIFMVNCLSKSHVSLYGYDQKTTPNLDRFARDAYIFNNLVSPATWTPPVLQELASGRIHPTGFFLEHAWPWEFPPLTDYPPTQDLVRRGYLYFQNKLPETGNIPFISFFHWDRTHHPYDPERKHRERLPQKEQAVYDRILEKLDDVQLVPSLADAIWPTMRNTMIFSIKPTLLPANDETLWNAILADLKKDDGSSTAFVASRLPSPLIQRLSQVQKAEQLSLQDKSAIVDALNAFIRDPQSPLQDVLFDRGLAPSGTERSDRAYIGATAVRVYHKAPDLFLTMSDGRLVLRDHLNKTQTLQLRRVYRELLESVFPSLTLVHYSQTCNPRLPVGETIQDVWLSSPDREVELSLMKHLYDAQVEETDAKFGECLRWLKKEGVLDKTIVVFLGDHGEAFMEHGMMEHTLTHCYDEVINPPLVIRVPGALSAPMKIDTQLRTADVFPTLIGLMGFPLPETSDPLAGRNLAPSLGKAAPEPDVTAFSRDYDLYRSVRRNDGWKLITMEVLGWEALYNVKKDPKELHNVAADFPDIAASLEEEMNRFLYGN